MLARSPAATPEEFVFHDIFLSDAMALLILVKLSALPRKAAVRGFRSDFSRSDARLAEAIDVSGRIDQGLIFDAGGIMSGSSD